MRIRLHWRSTRLHCRHLRSKSSCPGKATHRLYCLGCLTVNVSLCIIADLLQFGVAAVNACLWVGYTYCSSTALRILLRRSSSDRYRRLCRFFLAQWNSRIRCCSRGRREKGRHCSSRDLCRLNQDTVHIRNLRLCRRASSMLEIVQDLGGRSRGRWRGGCILNCELEPLYEQGNERQGKAKQGRGKARQSKSKRRERLLQHYYSVVATFTLIYCGSARNW